MRTARMVCLAAVVVIPAWFAWAESPSFDRLAIVVERDASEGERRVADLLKSRILEAVDLAIDVATDPVQASRLNVHLGIQRPQGRLHDLCMAHQVKLPGRKDVIFAEGYAAKAVISHEATLVVAVSADQRGLLYAAGEILRRLKVGDRRVQVAPFDVSTSPGFRYRGFSANQGGTMMKITGARSWSEDERRAVMLEYALAGANMFYSSDQPSPTHDYLKSFDLMTTTGARPNQLRTPFPPEWKAGGRESWEGQDWVCPSIPEARAALLKQWDEDFAKRADHEVMRFFAGDPGGCTDERCTPWGKAFVELCEEMAAIWLKYHPNSTIQIANQGLDNAGDDAILQYLNEKPRPWCYGLCYGPGSNAMSPYFRDIDMRDDLFEYAGHGPVNRYLSELHRRLPDDQRIVHYSDITHWISAQYAVANPERNIVKSYGRRTFHARPKAMYAIFQAIMPFSEGDIIYSEGNHDEFHQYLWSRMLWNPNRSLDDLMMEYCTLYFGEEAAPTMVQALFQLESSLETPLATNDGIRRYYDLVSEAGRLMPPWRMTRDWRWRLHMQKAALDCYVQDKLRLELDKEQRVRDLIAGEATDERIAKALAVLDEPAETDSMKALREEAGRLGEETNVRHGDRIPGYFRLEQPLRDLPGLRDLLREARDATPEKRADLLKAAVARMEEPTRTGIIFW